MRLKLRRVIITLVWAASLVAAGPAIGYAQGASERLALQTTAREHGADLSADESGRVGIWRDVMEQVK